MFAEEELKKRTSQEFLSLGMTGSWVMWPCVVWRICSARETRQAAGTGCGGRQVHLLAVVIEPSFPEPLELKFSRTQSKAHGRVMGCRAWSCHWLCTVSVPSRLLGEGHLLPHQLAGCSQAAIGKACVAIQGILCGHPEEGAVKCQTCLLLM